MPDVHIQHSVSSLQFECLSKRAQEVLVKMSLRLDRRLRHLPILGHVQKMIKKVVNVIARNVCVDKKAELGVLQSPVIRKNELKFCFKQNTHNKSIMTR